MEWRGRAERKIQHVLDGVGDDDAAERKKGDERETRDDSGGAGESDTDDETTHTWLRPDQGDRGAGVADDVAFEEAAHSKKKTNKHKELVPKGIVGYLLLVLLACG